MFVKCYIYIHISNEYLVKLEWLTLVKFMWGNFFLPFTSAAKVFGQGGFQEVHGDHVGHGTEE